MGVRFLDNQEKEGSRNAKGNLGEKEPEECCRILPDLAKV